jgi:hypothetical protein
MPVPFQKWEAKNSTWLINELEHLHQCSVCDPAMETSDEVHMSDPVNPLETFFKTTRVFHKLQDWIT